VVDEGARRTPATALLIVAIFLVAANMRATITGVGPLLPDITAETGYGEALLGVLTAIPMLVWGVVSPFVATLANRFGLNATMGWALAGLLVGTVLRSVTLPAEVGLWIGTLLVGIALAIINVLMPVATRRDFGARASMIVGFNTNMLTILAAAASGLVVPLSLIPLGGGTLGWRFALALTGVLVPFAIVFWFIAHRRQPPAVATPVPVPTAPVAPRAAPAVPRELLGRRIWTDRIAWWLSIYMALQATQFFIISSWHVKIVIEIGVPQAEGGLQLTVLQLVGMGATACLPLLRRNAWIDRQLPFLAAIPGVVAGVGMVLAGQWSWLWVLVLAFTSGPCLAIPLIQIGERAHDTATATALSGMVNSFGYLVSGLGPIAFGALHTLTGGWAVSQWFYVAVLAALLGSGWALRKPGLVLESPARVR
jgi:CP family cyanate transporter-like MFS transporter